MNFFYDTNNKAITLVLTVTTQQEQEIRIVVEDPTRPNTEYTNRVGNVSGQRVFKVRIPDSPKQVLVHIFNKAHGPGADTYNVVSGKLVRSNNAVSDPSFQVISVTDEKCVILRRAYDSNNRDVKEALEFFKKFSNRAGWISAGPSIEGDKNCGSMYRSVPTGKFVIRYVDVIIDWNHELYDNDGNSRGPNPNYGKALVTPARINWKTGIIEVSKKHFLKYTIPERLIILLHEFSHKYRSKDITNEIEADIHGALIYLCEGYPRIEIFKAFYVVFDEADTPGNRQRRETLEKFVDDFENREYKNAA